MIDLLLSASIVLLGYAVTDRLLARYLTGDWLGQPRDIDPDTGEVE